MKNDKVRDAFNFYILCFLFNVKYCLSRLCEFFVSCKDTKHNPEKSNEKQITLNV